MARYVSRAIKIVERIGQVLNGFVYDRHTVGQPRRYSVARRVECFRESVDAADDTIDASLK